MQILFLVTNNFSFYLTNRPVFRFVKAEVKLGSLFSLCSIKRLEGNYQGPRDSLKLVMALENARDVADHPFSHPSAGD